jgi:acyl carrier protein
VDQPPRTPLETDLVRLYRRTTGTAEVGIDNDFFAVGGSSVTAIDVVTEIHERFGVEMSLDTFFELATVAKVAAYVARAAH